MTSINFVRQFTFEFIPFSLKILVIRIIMLVHGTPVIGSLFSLFMSQRLYESPHTST